MLVFLLDKDEKKTKAIRHEDEKRSDKPADYDKCANKFVAVYYPQGLGNPVLTPFWIARKG